VCGTQNQDKIKELVRYDELRQNQVELEEKKLMIRSYVPDFDVGGDTK
jgi:hypothetical protein